jgi:hypothetical protein
MTILVAQQANRRHEFQDKVNATASDPGGFVTVGLDASAPKFESWSRSSVALHEGIA